MALACLTLLAGGCASTAPQTRLGADAMRGVRRIAVEIPDPGTLETPTMRGEDSGPAFRALESPDCRAPLEAALRENLIATRRFQVDVSHQEYADSNLVGYGALVRIEIESCGFRMLDQERRILAAFVDLTFRVKTGKTSSTGWRSRQSFAGNAHSSLLELEAHPELVRSEFQQVLSAAGRRLASELSYP